MWQVCGGMLWTKLHNKEETIVQSKDAVPKVWPACMLKETSIVALLSAPAAISNRAFDTWTLHVLYLFLYHLSCIVLCIAFDNNDM